MALSPLLQRYDQVILDLDGCVWIGDEPVDGSVAAVSALREAGKRVAFATNNSWHPGEEHVTKLWGLGIQASLADVVTVGGAMQHLLAETRSGRTAFVIGRESLRRHVADAGLKVLNGTDLASRVDLVVVGADRIAANGDAANKIGTYGLALAAAYHGIPLYVVAPTSTVDLTTSTGAEIPIEERDGTEVTPRFEARNPAFDVTPAALIGAIVTEVGVHRAPYESSLPRPVRTA